MHKPALRRWLAPCIGECISHCRPIEHQGAVHGVGVRLCAILFVLTECAHRWLQVPLNRIYDRGICHDSCTGLRIRDSTDESVERSEEHTSELQSLMRISYAVFCLKKKTENNK